MRSVYATALAALRLLLLVFVASTSAAAVEKRQWTDTRYCNPAGTGAGAGGLCYLEFRLAASLPVFRIAVPDGAQPPFDVVLEMVVPTSWAWAGFAWGGGMTLNPLTVAWPNGNKATVSSRWSSYVPLNTR